MKQKLFNLLFFTLSLGVLPSCEKGEDTEKPAITVAEPSMDDTITLSAEPEVHLEFTTTDNQGLRELKVKVTNSMGTELFAENPDVGGLKVFAYHEHFEPLGISGLTPLTVTLKATDKNDNEEIRIIPIFVRP